jgi:hypothetical protein
MKTIRKFSFGREKSKYHRYLARLRDIISEEKTSRIINDSRSGYQKGRAQNLAKNQIEATIPCFTMLFF